MKFFVFKVRKLIQKVLSSFNLQYFDVAYGFLKRTKNKRIYYLLHNIFEVDILHKITLLSLLLFLFHS